MADINSGPGWSEAQWDKVNGAITEAFEKASVAGAFIPCYGPLPWSAEYVKKEELIENGGVKYSSRTTRLLKLFNLTIMVESPASRSLTTRCQVRMLAFRRAANTRGTGRRRYRLQWLRCKSDRQGTTAVSVAHAAIAARRTPRPRLMPWKDDHAAQNRPRTALVVVSAKSIETCQDCAKDPSKPSRAGKGSTNGELIRRGGRAANWRT